MNDNIRNIATPHALAVDSLDGHRADLLVHLPHAPRGALLWAPALGVPASKYSGFAAAMAAQGIAVALHELRGTGSSNWRAGRDRDWGYAQLLADLDASRAALQAAHPQLHWHVGGHSLGAQLAGLALALKPDAYQGLAIVGSGQPWWRGFPPLQRLPVLGVFAWFRFLTLVCGYFPGDRVGFGGREARSVMRDWARSGASGRYRVDEIETDLEDALARIELPVLAVQLAQDRFAPRGSLNHLLEKLPRAKVTRHEIPAQEFERGRADHFSWMKDPAPVVRRIEAWFGQSTGLPHTLVAPAQAGAQRL